MPFFTSKPKRNFQVKLNDFFPVFPIKKTTLRLLYALLNVKKNNTSSLTMEIQITPMGQYPFILTDDNIFDLFDSNSCRTEVRITKNCSGTKNKILRRYCCAQVIKFINIFNESIIPVLNEGGVQDLKDCKIGLIYENNDPTNIFYPCEAFYDHEINMFLKCWDHQSMTASELRQQPTTTLTQAYDGVTFWNSDPVVGGRTRRRRQKRVRSRVRQPRRRSTK